MIFLVIQPIVQITAFCAFLRNKSRAYVQPRTQNVKSHVLLYEN
jgi:hypothetical protein